jgi:hypothetical protein
MSISAGAKIKTGLGVSAALFFASFAADIAIKTHFGSTALTGSIGALIGFGVALPAFISAWCCIFMLFDHLGLMAEKERNREFSENYRKIYGADVHYSVVHTSCNPRATADATIDFMGRNTITTVDTTIDFIESDGHYTAYDSLAQRFINDYEFKYSYSPYMAGGKHYIKSYDRAQNLERYIEANPVRREAQQTLQAAFAAFAR